MHCDAIIIGARCAGSATARLLAQGGMDVVAVDRAEFPSDTVSTHAMSSHGSVLLRDWGLFDRVVEAGTPNPKEISFSVGGVTVERFPLPEDNPGSLSPRRTVLDKLLVEAAREAGAQVWTSTVVDDLIRDRDRVVGVLGRREGKPFEVTADLVIGADGAQSPTAAHVGAETYRSHPSQCAGTYAYFADTDVDHNALAFRDRQATLAFATNDGLACVAVAVAHADAAAVIGGGDAAFFSVMEQVWPELAERVRAGSRASRFTVFRPRPTEYRTPFGPGWAPVGDAGHYLDPVTGQGMANALLDAHLLAEALLRDGDLAAYQGRRDELTSAMHDVTGRLSTMAWTNEEVLQLFLEYRQTLVELTEAVSGALRPAAA